MCLTFLRRICFVFVLSILSCTSAPDLGELYNQSAQYHRDRTPVIVIPGILGTKLIQKDTKKIVWGAYRRTYANPNNPKDARLIAHPMKKGLPLRELKDDVVPDGVLDRFEVNLFGLPIQLNAYMQILKTLGIGGYRDETIGQLGNLDYGEGHFTCFQFDYDWRRDIVENAKRLHQFILKKQSYVQREIKKRYGVKKSHIRFDIITHSMGGLIARYYLRYGEKDLLENQPVPPPDWEGAKNVRNLVMIAPPNLGSIAAFRRLVEGVQFAFFFPKYESSLLGTMPSIYQTLPRNRQNQFRFKDQKKPFDVDLYDPKLWEKMEWGLASPDQDSTLKLLLPKVNDRESRKEIALDHLAKCLNRAQLLQQHLDVEASPPESTKIHLYAGDAVDTEALVEIDRETGDFNVLKQKPGDGLVLRSSALGDIRTEKNWTPHLKSPITWERVSFLFTDHFGITKDPNFSDNILFLLLEKQNGF